MHYLLIQGPGGINCNVGMTNTQRFCRVVQASALRGQLESGVRIRRTGWRRFYADLHGMLSDVAIMPEKTSQLFARR